MFLYCTDPPHIAREERNANGLQNALVSGVLHDADDRRVLTHYGTNGAALAGRLGIPT